jgi:hypothetical protein
MRKTRIYTKIPKVVTSSLGNLVKSHVLIGLLGISLGGFVTHYFHPVKVEHKHTTVAIDPYTKKEKVLIETISTEYKVPLEEAAKIFRAAKDVSYAEGFPMVHHLLAIAAIESSFNRHAVSYAGAKGLVQILYKPTTFEIRGNLQDGVALLTEYRRALGSEDAAIQSYNVGIGNYIKGMRNQDYLNKYKREKYKFKELLT